MFRATILPIFRRTRLCNTTCGMLHPIRCRSVIWWWWRVPPSPDYRPATYWVDCVWNVMAHAQKPHFIFRRNGRVHLTFSRLMTYIYIYICRTAPLTSRCCILYIYSTNIRTEYFKHAAHSPFFPLQNAIYFIMLPFLVPVLFTF